MFKWWYFICFPHFISVQECFLLLPISRHQLLKLYFSVTRVRWTLSVRRIVIMFATWHYISVCVNQSSLLPFFRAMNLWDNYDKSLVWYSRTHVHHIISIKRVWSFKTINYRKQKKLINFFQICKTKETFKCSSWCQGLSDKTGFWTLLMGGLWIFFWLCLFMSGCEMTWGKQIITDPDHMHFGVGSQKGLSCGSRISRRQTSTFFGETDTTFSPFLQKQQQLNNRWYQE